MTGEVVKKIEMKSTILCVIEYNHTVFIGTDRNRVVITDLELNIQQNIDVDSTVNSLLISMKKKLIIG